MQIDIFFIDFDSTFITFEALDKAIDMAVQDALKDNSNDEKVKNLPTEISKITEMGMNGEIQFKDSLRMRIEAAKGFLKEEHFKKIGKIALQSVSETIPELIEKIQKSGKEIYILTSGFKAVVEETGNFYKVNGIFANTHIADENGYIIGYDLENPLSGNGGKIETIKNFLNGKNKKTMVIGDGITDYEAYGIGVCDYFLNFAINKDRKLYNKKQQNEDNFIVCKTHEEMREFIGKIE